MLLVAAALAPSIALLYYFYMRDKYEKEPRGTLIKAFLLGVIIILPVLYVEMKLNVFEATNRNLISVGYTAFVVAGLVEETFKYIAFIFIIWKSKEFDEMYDGIVYCVFISLGFATVENIAYVYSRGGLSTALIRSFTAVPAHALFAVSMGYYLGISKFVSQNKRLRYQILGILVPILLHGVYDFILLSQQFILFILFVPYMLYLWKISLNSVDKLVDASPYKSLRKKRNGI